MADDLGNVYELVAGRLLSGTVVPVLGAGANLGDRPPDVGYQRGRYLPNGGELAEEFAKRVHYPGADTLDLARVSQYVAATMGEGALYDGLHNVFAADYPPTRLHYFLARLARHTREAAAARECMLLMTTNYDDALEQAFRVEGEPYDLITYISSGDDLGLFRHIPFDGEPSAVWRPLEYTDLPLDRRTVIAKIHGTVDRLNPVDPSRAHCRPRPRHPSMTDDDRPGPRPDDPFAAQVHPIGIEHDVLTGVARPSSWLRVRAGGGERTSRCRAAGGTMHWPWRNGRDRARVGGATNTQFNRTREWTPREVSCVLGDRGGDQQRRCRYEHDRAG